MNFHASDLDGAYDTLNNLYLLSTKDGEKIESKLVEIIFNLQKHWKGNDATIHINNLIDVYKGLNSIINCVLYVAHNVSIPIVKAQTIRNANGGRGNVGNLISYNQETRVSFEQLDITAEYFVDPIGAPFDYNELCEVCDLFKLFCTNFSQYKDELLNNWTSGNDRDKAINEFGEFETNVSMYISKLNNAKGNLEVAVSNLKEV